MLRFHRPSAFAEFAHAVILRHVYCLDGDPQIRRELEVNVLRVLTEEEVRESLRMPPYNRNDQERASFDGENLYFAHPESNCIGLDYPAKLEQLPFFARQVATAAYDDKDFQGALVWITAWGVWNYVQEGVGYRIIEAMHAATGQPRSLEAGPGHTFRADELNEAVAMLMQPMVFGWDAFYLPNWSYGVDEFFVHISHDSFVSMITRTKEFHDKAFGTFQELGFSPAPGHEMQRKRFCHKP